MVRSPSLCFLPLTKIFCCAMLLLLAALPMQNAQGADWPEYRHNPSRGGATEEQLATEALGQLWVYDAPLPPVTAWHGPAKWDAWIRVRNLNSMRNYDPVFHPIVVDNHVYFGSSSDDSIHCLDLSSGETVWQFTAGGPIRIAPTWVDGKLYFGSDDGFAYCVSAAEGTLIWKYSPNPEKRQLIHQGRMISFWPCRTGVTVVEDTAYFGCSLLPWKSSYLCAVDAQTGQPEGEGRYVKTFAKDVTMEGALLVSPNLIICPQGRIAPKLYNRADGESRGALAGSGGSFVVMVNESLVVHGPGNKRGWLDSTNPESRERIARYDNGNAIVVDGDNSYMITDDHVIASNWSTQENIWQVEANYPYELILAGDTLFVGGDNKVGALSTETGEEIWSATVEGRAYGLAVANQRLVVATDTGNLYCFGEGGARVAAPSEAVVEAEEATPSANLAAGPWIDFDTPTSAVIRWETKSESATILDYGLGMAHDQSIREETPKTNHEVRLENIGNRQVYFYTISSNEGGEEIKSGPYECDTFFNYNRPVYPEPTGIFADANQGAYASAAEEILSKSPAQQGICLVLESESGRLGYEIARQSEMKVVCFCTDQAQVDRSRAALLEAGVYGGHVAVKHVSSYDSLNLPYHFANLIVSEKSLSGEVPSLGAEAIARYLHPVRGLAIFGPSASLSEIPIPTVERNLLEWRGETGRNPFGADTLPHLSWFGYYGEPLPETGSWTHMYGNADNAAFTGEALGEATSINELEIQWLGRPGPRYHVDRQGRKNSPLVSNGRIYLQGLQRIVTLDAYNGTVLWSLELPTFLRFNIPRNTSNWCADDDFLYAAIEDRCWKIDAATGEIVSTHAVEAGPRSEWGYEWGYVARTENLLLGSAIKSGAMDINYWGRSGWYEKHAGSPVQKVCSDNLFAASSESGEQLWTYQRGLILNSTITVGEDCLYFLESRNEELLAGEERKLESAPLWNDLYMVCLNVQTGELLWEQSADELEVASIMVSLAHADGKLILVCNNIAEGLGCQHTTYCFDASTGLPVWDNPAVASWSRTDHGKALSRPVIVNGMLFVRPAVINLESGEIADFVMPHGGCGTYVCSSNAVFFRSGSGNKLTVWNPDANEVSAWPRLRPDCWLSTVPAGGMLLSPEGGGGCSCGKWMETSIGFIPARFDVPTGE